MNLPVALNKGEAYIWTDASVDQVEIVDGGSPVHPGEILREEYLEPLSMSAGVLARKLNRARAWNASLPRKAL